MIYCSSLGDSPFTWTMMATPTTPPGYSLAMLRFWYRSELNPYNCISTGNAYSLTVCSDPGDPFSPQWKIIS